MSGAFLQKTQDRPAVEAAQPVNEEVSVSRSGPRSASFLLEVRNRAQVTNELGADLIAVLAANGFDITLTPVVDTASDEADREAPIRAAARGEAQLVKWIQEGVLVEGRKVADAWGIKRQAVDAARERGEIFSVWVKGKHWYPSDVLKLKRAELTLINRVLGDIDPSGKLLFLLRKHGALGGHTAADAIMDGRMDDVLRLAVEWARA